MSKSTIPDFSWKTIAGGSVGGPGHKDAPFTTAQFSSPSAISRGAGGHLYVADRSNHVVCKISPQGMVSTRARDPVPAALFAGSQSD